ncbi:MAG TPA: hypothetical protein VE568_10035 [Rubrobacter sp.]|nr:hypothetical protein [Rubrobacter sp.]
MANPILGSTPRLVPSPGARAAAIPYSVSNVKITGQAHVPGAVGRSRYKEWIMSNVAVIAMTEGRRAK